MGGNLFRQNFISDSQTTPQYLFFSGEKTRIKIIKPAHDITEKIAIDIIIASEEIEYQKVETASKIITSIATQNTI